MPTHPILIAGGGIAGVASALSLVRNGRASCVFEKAEAFETIGAGLQIGPNAVRALKYLDVWDTLAASAFAPPAIFIRDGHSGRLLQEIRLGIEFERRFGEPYRVIHRADLLTGLVERARMHSAIQLKTGAEVMQFADKGGYVEIETRSGSVRGEALLGADGIRSVIRQTLAADGPPVRHGEVLFRALTTFDTPMPERLAGITLWLCRQGHVVHYPVRGGKALNVVAAAMNSPWPGEGWSAPADRQEVMAHFSKIHEDLFQVLAVSSPWLKWAAADRGPTAWSRNRVTLVGDAAHAALPYLAQGAAMALEDSVALSLCAQRSNTIAAAFNAYEALRKPRTQRMAAESRRMGRIYHAKGLLRVARNGILRLTDQARFIDRLAWIYDYDPGA